MDAYVSPVCRNWSRGNWTASRNLEAVRVPWSDGCLCHSLKSAFQIYDNSNNLVSKNKISLGRINVVGLSRAGLG